MTHVLSLSYGKDSLACLEACKILGYPIDRVIHAEVWATDTIPADLPPMVDFKRHADRIIKERYGLTVEHIAATSRERERDCLTTDSSMRNASIKSEIEKAFTDSLYCGERGAIPGSKCNHLTHCEKQTYEKMFYQVPKRKTESKQGLIKGFPGVMHTKWCAKLKVRCFRKAPLHKELIQILCSILALRLTSLNGLSGILAPALSSLWWTSDGTKPIAESGVRRTTCFLPSTRTVRGAVAGSATIKEWSNYACCVRIIQSYGSFS